MDSLIGMATFRRKFSKEVVLLALLAAFVASAYGVYAWRDKKEEAFRNLDNLALLSARSSALFFRHFELSLQTLSQEIVRKKSALDSHATHDLLVRFQTNDDRLAVSNIFSPEGQSLSSSNLAVGQRIPETRGNIALQAGLADAMHHPGLHIGRPLSGLTGLILHEMVIPMRYAFRNESGKPLFVVTAVIAMSKQHQIWQPVSLPDGAAIGLLRDDGVLQGRWPEVADPVRVYAAPNNGFFLDKLRAEGFPDSGRAQGLGTLAAGHRLIAFHRVPGFPLTAFVATSRSEVWRQWALAVWMPFLLFALMAFCSVLIYRYALYNRVLWEKELQARQMALELRNEISAHAMQGLAMEELLRIIVLKTVQHFQDMWCTFATVDARGILQVQESSSPGCRTALKTLDLSRVPVHLAALRKEKPVIFADATATQAFVALAAEVVPAGTQSIINLPVSLPGNMLGVLSVGASKAHSWRDGEIALLSEIALDISFSMKEAHSRLERENALTRLSEGEARFRDLTALSSDWYWEQDEHLRFVNASHGIFQKLGRNPADMVGKTRRELPGNVFSDAEWNAHQAILDARLPFFDFTFKRMTTEGETRWVSLSGRPIFDAHGAFKGYRGVGKDVTDSKFAQERIQYLAYHDDLTTLPNRSNFSRILSHAISQAHRNHTGLAVLFIDLDRFKNLNDTLGHEAGDLLLREIGKRLRHCVRQSDTVARLGGDEFVVLLEDHGEPESVALVARKVLSDIAKPFDILGREIGITASVGISLYPIDGGDEQILMKRADIAMYHAKQEGKNNYQFHTERMDTYSFERAALESNLRGALERGEFRLHYQPKVEIKSGRITGVEALIRWWHPDMKEVSPAQFIPVAEETGLIVPIGQLVLRTACLQNKAWQDAGLPHLCVAVNLSVRQFAHDNLLDDIASTLRETGLDPALLELEITESMIMHNVAKAVQVLVKLKRMGVRLAIDDFGTGYSSLSNLKRFPLDTIKVDRSFISDIPSNSDDMAITSAIIAMGRSLGLTVIAEGVETGEQLGFLRDHGCHEYQGYFFSKPVDAREIGALLRSYDRAKDQRPLAANPEGAAGRFNPVEPATKLLADEPC